MQVDEKTLLSLLADEKTQHKAFEILVRQYSEPLYRQIRRMVLYHDDADDVMQNTFIKAWKGGNMRNAIPREAEVVLTLPKENVSALAEAVAEWQETFQAEYGFIEPSLSLTMEEVAHAETMVPSGVQDNLVNAICAAHNGILRYIPDVPGIVETSSNLAVVEIGGGKAEVLILIRSSRDSMRECLVETLESAFSMAGMKVETGGEYPAWQPNPKSEIVELMQEIYRDMFHKENKVLVIHAGLECGVIGAHRPHMDLVSFGPTLRSPHTPNERCH